MCFFPKLWCVFQKKYEAEECLKTAGFLSLIQCKHRCRNHPNSSLSAPFFFFLATLVERVLEKQGKYIKERLCGLRHQQQFGSIYWSWQTDTTFTFMTFFPKGNVFFTDISRTGKEKWVLLKVHFFDWLALLFGGKGKKNVDCGKKNKIHSELSLFLFYYVFNAAITFISKVSCKFEVTTCWINVLGASVMNFVLLSV